MNLSSIPLHLPFLDVLADGWLSRFSGDDPIDAARGLILLPTRRAARALTEAFLRASGGRALLMPRIAALGALDEAPLALGAWLEAAPAVLPMRRLALLSRMVLAAGSRFGTAPTLDQAWPLAQALAELMDEAERADCDLAAALPQAADEFAEHWQVTLEFLRIVTQAWPAWLAENGLCNPVARQMALLRAQAQAWRETPPPGPVWAAGFTERRRRWPSCCAPSPGWSGAGCCCPASTRTWTGCCRSRLGAAAAQPSAGRAVAAAGPAGRHAAATCGRSRPAWRPRCRRRGCGRSCARCCRSRRWATGSTATIRCETAGLARLHGADQQEEAAAIALVLRDALERPGRRAALVTPDRALAGRVAVELARFGVLVDDSAGEPLAAHPAGDVPAPAGAAVRGAAGAGGAAVAAEAPAGRRRACRRPHAAQRARRLELHGLRGPAPGRVPSAAGRWHGGGRGRDPDPAVPAFLERLDCLAPLLELPDPRAAPPTRCWRRCCGRPRRWPPPTRSPAPRVLWAGEEGNALARTWPRCPRRCAGLPAQRRRCCRACWRRRWPGSRCAAGGRCAGSRTGAEHPRCSSGACWKRGCRRSS